MIKILDVLGSKLITNKIDTDRSFTLSIIFRTGANNEDENEKGLSHLLEHMMFTGTNKRTSYQISEEMDFYGANFNAYTSKEVTNYYFSSLTSKQKETTEIFFDMICDPIFPENELKKEKEIIFEEINMSNDETRQVNFQIMSEKLFTGNLKYNILGSIESVGSFTRENLMDYYRRRYTQDNMMILISGNFDEELLISMINEYFVNMPKKSVKKDFEKPMLLNKEEYIKRDQNQVNVYMMTQFNREKKERKTTLIEMILEIILGDGFSSRLFQEIREKRMLAYSVYSFGMNYDDFDGLGIYIGTSKNKYEEAIKASREVIDELKEKGISERELEKTKNYILSSNASAKENSRLISRYYNSYINYSKIYTDDEIEIMLKDITVEDINNKAKELLNNFSICVIGDIDDRQ